MCGIAGAFAQKITDNDVRIIQDVVKSQHNRGPDHTACDQLRGSTADAVFGHNRLSILDLSDRGNQPMWDESGRYCITYNGEIYNYIELENDLQIRASMPAGRGDTAVILSAFAKWGNDAVIRFNGPFAFAIFDRMTGELQLFRDRFGVRPLYYINTGAVFYFASTAAVFARAFSLKPDLAWLASGLNSLAYNNGGDNAPWQGINCLQPGHSLRVRVNPSSSLSVTVTKYYDPETRVMSLMETLPLHDVVQLTEQIEYNLQRAVKLRLRSDVPVGVTMSSGLDSSTVAALASHNNIGMTGFSFGSPENVQSEGVLASRCASFLGLRMEYVDPDPSEMVDAFFETIDAQQEPFSGISMVAQYLLYKHIKKCGIKVILGGQGGDEAFMGYRKYILFYIRHLFAERRFNAAAFELLKFMPAIWSEMGSFKIYWQNRHRYVKSSPVKSSLVLPEVPSSGAGISAGQTLRSRQLQDITDLSLPTLLRYEDRNAMGNSVESRLPFMDYHVIELGLALPVALKLRAGYAKWPVRRIMQNKIPDCIRLARYKRGFDIPLKPVLSAGLGKRIRETLMENRQVVKNFLVPGLTIEAAFSDSALKNRPGCFAEAIAMLWMGRFCA